MNFLDKKIPYLIALIIILIKIGIYNYLRVLDILLLIILIITLLKLQRKLN